MFWSAPWKVSVLFAVFVIGGLTVEAADLRVMTVDGVTTVVFNGEQVFMGSTSGTVSSRAGSYDGVELAAAYDGEKVIWENVSGAGRYLREAERRQERSRDPGAGIRAEAGRDSNRRWGFRAGPFR